MFPTFPLYWAAPGPRRRAPSHLRHAAEIKHARKFHAGNFQSVFNPPGSLLGVQSRTADERPRIVLALRRLFFHADSLAKISFINSPSLYEALLSESLSALWWGMVRIHHVFL